MKFINEHRRKIGWVAVAVLFLAFAKVMIADFGPFLFFVFLIVTIPALLLWNAFYNWAFESTKE